jgi:hypothetical protein
MVINRVSPTLESYFDAEKRVLDSRLGVTLESGEIIASINVLVIVSDGK